LIPGLGGSSKIAALHPYAGRDLVVPLGFVPLLHLVKSPTQLMPRERLQAALADPPKELEGRSIVSLGPLRLTFDQLERAKMCQIEALGAQVLQFLRDLDGGFVRQSRFVELTACTEHVA
jgi:hypothetical protein